MRHLRVYMIPSLMHSIYFSAVAMILCLITFLIRPPVHRVGSLEDIIITEICMKLIFLLQCQPAKHVAMNIKWQSE